MKVTPYIRKDTCDQIIKSKNLPTFAHVLIDPTEDGHVFYWMGWCEERKGRVSLVEGGYRSTPKEVFMERFMYDSGGVWERFKALI